MKGLVYLISIAAMILCSINANATNIVNAASFCSPGLLYDNDEAKTACPDTCTKMQGKWNGQWVGTSDYKCTGSNDRGSVCGCNFTGCSDLVINYEHPKYNAPDWIASVWYTPCGSNQEAGTAWHATNWTNNRLKVATGSRVRIGLMGSITSTVDKVVTKSTLNVLCSGGASGPTTQNNPPPCCRDENIPLPPCTTVYVLYESDVTWAANITYTPCRKCLPETEISTNVIFSIYNNVQKHIFDVASGTRVRIGRMFLKGNFIDENMSGSDVKINCSGHLLGEASCCVLGRPNCPKKQTKVKKESEKKAAKKTPDKEPSK
jgi:hypothetical protein